MQVTVVDRRGSDGWRFEIKTIQIADTCPKCGGPRGTPTLRPYCEDGYHYGVDNWVNPCGHQDLYADVLNESEEMGQELIADQMHAATDEAAIARAESR
jgi:hypothetical protein